ncbi:MAG: DUF47 family protein [Acidimicrobiia bacterium]
MSTKRWFLPDNPHLLDMLGRQADITMDGMEALVAWAGGDPAAGDAVRDREHQADDQKRELWRGLRDAFSPPLDAEDLFTLSAELDEVLNSAKDLVREMEVMNLEPNEPTRQMVGLIADAVSHLVQAFAHLGSSAGDATEEADAAIKSQRRVERAYRAAMSALLDEADVATMFAWREIYRRLSRMGDLVHAVAERVWYAVVKEA